ncbi:hypothetical protein PENTCL1PPCAC_29104, partial [Pristionchus entomophagus]
ESPSSSTESLVALGDAVPPLCEHCITHIPPGKECGGSARTCFEYSEASFSFRLLSSSTPRPRRRHLQLESASADSDADTLPDAAKVTGDEGLFAGKVVSVTSWMQNTPDRRAVKGTAKTRLTNGDVYPQELKQDEDNLGSDKLRKGFTTGPCNYEHDTVNGVLDRNDAHYRAAQFYMQVVQRKGEMNLIANAKESKKSKDSVNQLPVASPVKGKERWVEHAERVQWYQNLAKGKAYAALMQKPPVFKKKEHMFDYLYDFKITPTRAIWNLKLAANMAANHKKKNQFNGEIFGVEFAHAISRVIRGIFNKLYKLETLDECDETNEKWYYFTRLSISAFDEGAIDRQEFINELCDIFSEIFLRRIHKKIDTFYQMNMWMQYFSYFVPSATQNLVLARRIAVMMCQKLSMMKEEFEEEEAELLNNISEGRYVFTEDGEDDGSPRNEPGSMTGRTDDMEGTDPPPPPSLKDPLISVKTPDTSKNSPATAKVLSVKREDAPGSAGTPKGPGAPDEPLKTTEEIMATKIKEEPLDEDELPSKEKRNEGASKDPAMQTIVYDPEHPDKFTFDVMFACPPIRQPLNSLVSLLFTCIGEQPGAMVYNKFFVGLNRQPFMLTQLGGSPLDYLPCPLLDLPFEIGNENAQENILELMEIHEHDIILRSELVQNQWVLTFHTQRQHAKLIDGCLDVIGYLDSFDILKKGAVEKICDRIFLRMKYARYAHEVCARIRLCFTWAITVQRDGQWRGWLVAKVLARLMVEAPKRYEEPYGYFGGTHINLILIDFINNDLPKSGDENFYKEYKNFCSIFFEFLRFEVYTHESLYAMFAVFRKEYCRRMELVPDPIMLAHSPVNDEGEAKEGRKEGETSVGSQDCNRMDESVNSKMDVDDDDSIVEIKAELMDEDGQAVKIEPKEEIVEIEEAKKEKKIVSLISLPEEEVDGYRLLDEDIPPLEQLVIQLPLRDEDERLSNNRTQMLYGDQMTKHNYLTPARRVADEFIKIMRRKMFTKWCKKGDDVKFARRSTPQQLKELLQKMKMHTLFDRQQINNWVADGFVNTVDFFIKNESLQLPTFEAFDLICSLFEQNNNMHGFFKFSIILVPKLLIVERVIRSFSSVIMPGLVLSQYTYVICSYLVKHLHYFVHFEKAKHLVNLLYRVMEKSLKAQDYPRNGFGRAAAACIYHLREQLIRSEVVDSEEMLGGMEEFADVFEQRDTASSGQKNYNARFMQDNFQNTTLRIYMYHDFKKRLPSFRDPINQYSFVVNAFIAASKLNRDFDRLSELASFCSHWTAQYPEMASDWMGAIRALCTARSNHFGFHHLLDQVDVSDCSLHYSISTFAVLLASKYCYSIPKLISELINSVFSSVMKKESGRTARGGTIYKNDYENEPNVCIALLYLAQMSCGSDDPFILSEHYRGRAPVRKLLVDGSADLKILSMVHWCELDRVVFPMIANIGIMHDTLQTRVRDHDIKLEVPEADLPRREYKKEYLPVIVRQVLVSICEQDWVKDRMYKIADMDDMVAFNQDRLKQNCLGQQLLRLGTRRRCERDILAQLSVCNGNSKKALIDKLFSVLNIWNFRATLYDLRLMIKEISPEVSKASQQHGIIADSLMGEIAKCCRQMFEQAYKQDKIILKKDERFSFSSLSNYLLIPTLIDTCPTPSNMPSSMPCVSFKTKFLSEICNLLDVGPEPTTERLKQSAWLIRDRAFLNIIMTCMKGSCRDDQAAKDAFVSSTLKQIQDLTKIKENHLHHYKTAHGEERKGVFLRLELIAYVFDEVCRPNTAEGWALILFQLMLHGVITPFRNLRMYNMAFDMLNSIITWSLTDVNNSNLVSNMTEKTGQEPKYRFPYYMQIVKKLRKELHDTKTMMETKNLHAFLPLPKSTQQMLSFEPFGTQPSNALKTLRLSQQANIGLRRGRPCLQIKKNTERIRINAFEMLQAYNPENTLRKFPGMSFYMGGRVDMSMIHPYRIIQRLMGHVHPLKGWVTNPLQLEGEEITDLFLNEIMMDPVGEPPWITKKLERDRREKAEKEKKAVEKDKAGDEKDDEDEDGMNGAKDMQRAMLDREKSAPTPAALAGPDKTADFNVKQEIMLKVKEEDIVVLGTPQKMLGMPVPSASLTPSKESELAKVIAQPLQATALSAHLPPHAMAQMGGGVAPAPVKATKRRSTANKDGTEKKERKRPTKRNAAGLTLNVGNQPPPLMPTPPKGLLGGPPYPGQMPPQGGMMQQQPGPSSYMGSGDWPTPPQQSQQRPMQPTLQQEQFAPPQVQQQPGPSTGKGTTLSELMGHNQPSAQQQQQSQMQKQQLHMQQQAAAAAAATAQQQQHSMQQQQPPQGMTQQQQQHMMMQQQQQIQQQQ